MEQLQEEQGPDRFAYVDFHIRGSLGSSVGDEREAYYRVSGTPTVLFDGKNRQVGGRNHESLYRAAIAAANTESQIQVGASASYDLSTGLISVSVDVEVGEAIEFPDECVVRAVLAEDLGGGRPEKKVARVRVLETALVADEEGETQMLSAVVRANEAWQTENMHVVAWVQRDSDHSERNAAILNAVQSAFGDATPVQDTSWGQLKATFR